MTGAVHDYYTRRMWGHDYTVRAVAGHRLRVAGWGPYDHKIVSGDYLCLEGPTKKVAIYKVTSIEYERDPPDMWFADAEYVVSKIERDDVLRQLETQVSMREGVRFR